MYASMSEIRQYDVRSMSITQLHERIRSDFPHCQLQPRYQLRLVSQYVKWLQMGTKCTTIRYRPGAIDVPSASELPLLESSSEEINNGRHDEDDQQVGTVRITSVVIKPFAMLDDQDARRDGFTTVSELKQALQWLYTEFYGPIGNDQYVSIYAIQLIA